jgi:ATP-dependent protease ClpP protease subunit
MSCCNENTIDYKEWNKHVPIKEKDGVFFVYITDDIEIPAAYNEITHRLYTASAEDNFVFVINSGGGVVESAIMIIDAIQRSEATVKMLVTGFCASAGTIIALSGAELEVADHSAFMIHNYSAGFGGKGHELKARQTFMDNSLNSAFADYYKGFLTETEVEEVIEGKDFWLAPAEVRTRWETRKKLTGA